MEIIRRPVPGAAASLAIAGVHPVLARLYAARGIASADELDLDLAQLPPFTMLKGIDDAATRLADAVQARERIVIVADYDADGAPACAAAARWAPMSISSSRTASSTATASRPKSSSSRPPRSLG